MDKLLIFRWNSLCFHLLSNIYEERTFPSAHEFLRGQMLHYRRVIREFLLERLNYDVHQSGFGIHTVSDAVETEQQHFVHRWILSVLWNEHSELLRGVNLALKVHFLFGRFLPSHLRVFDDHLWKRTTCFLTDRNGVFLNSKRFFDFHRADSPLLNYFSHLRSPIYR